MDPKKVSVVVEWQIPQNVRNVRSFLDSASYYRKFKHDLLTKAYVSKHFAETDPRGNAQSLKPDQKKVSKRILKRSMQWLNGPYLRMSETLGRFWD